VTFVFIAPYNYPATTTAVNTTVHVYYFCGERIDEGIVMLGVCLSAALRIAFNLIYDIHELKFVDII